MPSRVPREQANTSPVATVRQRQTASVRRGDHRVNPEDDKAPEAEPQVRSQDLIEASSRRATCRLIVSSSRYLARSMNNAQIAHRRGGEIPTEHIFFCIRSVFCEKIQNYRVLVQTPDLKTLHYCMPTNVFYLHSGLRVDAVSRQVDLPILTTRRTNPRWELYFGGETEGKVTDAAARFAEAFKAQMPQMFQDVVGRASVAWHLAHGGIPVEELKREGMYFQDRAGELNSECDPSDEEPPAAPHGVQPPTPDSDDEGWVRGEGPPRHPAWEALVAALPRSNRQPIQAPAASIMGVNIGGRCPSAPPITYQAAVAATFDALEDPQFEDLPAPEEEAPVKRRRGRKRLQKLGESKGAVELSKQKARKAQMKAAVLQLSQDEPDTSSTE